MRMLYIGARVSFNLVRFKPTALVIQISNVFFLLSSDNFHFCLPACLPFYESVCSLDCVCLLFVCVKPLLATSGDLPSAYSSKCRLRLNFY